MQTLKLFSTLVALLVITAAIVGCDKTIHEASTPLASPR